MAYHYFLAFPVLSVDDPKALLEFEMITYELPILNIFFLVYNTRRA